MRGSQLFWGRYAEDIAFRFPFCTKIKSGAVCYWKTLLRSVASLRPSNSASAAAVPVLMATVAVSAVAASLSLQSRCCTLHGTILREQDAASIRGLSNHLHSPRHHSVRTTARCKQTGSRGEPPWATIMLPAVH